MHYYVTAVAIRYFYEPETLEVLAWSGIGAFMVLKKEPDPFCQTSLTFAH